MMAQDCCSRQALLWVDFLYCQFRGVFCFRLQSKFRFPALSASSRQSHFFLQFQFLFVLHFLASVSRSMTRVHRQNLLAAQCDSGVCQQHSLRIVKHRCQSVQAQVFHHLSGYVLALSPADDDDGCNVDYVGVLDRNSSLFETTSIDALARLLLLFFRAVDRQELFQKELFLMNSQKQCWDSKNDILCTWAEFQMLKISKIVSFFTS